MVMSDASHLGIYRGDEVLSINDVVVRVAWPWQCWLKRCGCGSKIPGTLENPIGKRKNGLKPVVLKGWHLFDPLRHVFFFLGGGGCCSAFC